MRDDDDERIEWRSVGTRWWWPGPGLMTTGLRAAMELLPGRDDPGGGGEYVRTTTGCKVGPGPAPPADGVGAAAAAATTA
jgi:hypothetical protein